MAKKITVLMVSVILLLLSVAFASAYPINFRISSNVADFNTYVYKCADTACSSITYLTNDLGGTINEYSVAGTGTTYVAEYDFKPCVVSHMYKRWMDGSTGNGPWTYSITLTKMDNCAAAINSMSISASNVNIGTPVTISTDVAGNFHAPVGGPATVPVALRDPYYSADTDIKLEVRDSSNNVVYTETKNYNIFMDSNQAASFSWTPSQSGTYTLYIKTTVPDCMCSNSVEQVQSKVLVVNGGSSMDPQFIMDDVTTDGSTLTSTSVTIQLNSVSSSNPISYAAFYVCVGAGAKVTQHGEYPASEPGVDPVFTQCPTGWQLICNDSTSPYSCTYSGLVNGQIYDFAANMADNAKNVEYWVDENNNWVDDVRIQSTSNVPIAYITANPANGKAPLTSTLTCSASGGDSPLSYTLYFGDGTSTSSSSAISAAHTYNSVSIYTATCSVIDSNGDTDTDTVQIQTTQDNMPAAIITATPQTGVAPLSSAITCSASGGDSPLSYTLYFGDGQSTTSLSQISTVHTYSSAGIFTATCQVTDSDGDSDSDSAQIQVTQNNMPIATITADPQSGQSPLTSTVTCSASGGDSPISYTLTFGDGSSTSSSNPISTVHVYNTIGTFTAVCSVSDSNGDTDTDSVQIQTSQDSFPTATITANPQIGLAPLNSMITCSATGGNTPLSYTLYFGDGLSTTSSGTISVMHAYSNAGTYNAICQVTDTDGDSDSDSVQISVTQDSVPAASIIATPQSGQAPLTVSISCLSTGGDSPITYTLFYGDGLSTTSSSSISTTHTYSNAGTYVPICLVVDTDGDSDTDIVTVQVNQNNVPVAQVYVNPSTGQAPLNSAITCSATGGDLPLSYTLFFGDGTSTTSAAAITVSHAYGSVGTFTVICQVVDSNGDTDTDSTLITTTQNNVPSAIINATPTSGSAPLSSNIRCSSTGGDSPVSYVLYFGDGTSTSSSSLINVVHTYSNIGTYTAICQATDSNGDSDTDNLQISVVQDSVPDAYINATPTSGMPPLTSTIVCGTNGGDSPISYTLYFGDGSSVSSSSTITVSHVYSNSGTYSAICLVSDSDGDTDTAIVQITVSQDLFPTAYITAVPNSGFAPLSSAITCTGTGGNSPLSYILFFGDGLSQSSASPISTVHTYNNIGTYAAICQVTDIDGDINSASAQITVTSSPVILDPIFVMDDVTADGSTITNTFVNIALHNVSDRSGTGINYAVFYMCVGGGAEVSQHGEWPISEPGADPIFTQCPTGWVQVCNDTTAPYQCNYTNLSNGQLYDFTANLADNAGNVEYWIDENDNWVDDILVSTMPINLDPVFVMDDVTADGSTLASSSVNIQLHNVSDRSGTGLNFAAFYVCIGGGAEVVSYAEFPLGGIFTNCPTTWQLVCNDTVAPYECNYAGLSDGLYDFAANLADNAGNVEYWVDENNNWVDDINVRGQNIPAALITASPQTGLAPLYVTLTCTATGGDSPLSYTLFFGDGTSTTSSTPIAIAHTYSGQGTYTAICQATDASSDSDTDSIQIQVGTDLTPTATIRATPTSGLAPLNVQINCTGTGGNAPLAYVLFFGDSTNQSSSSPIYTVHTYSSVSTFTAVCQVTDSDGDANIDTIQITTATQSVPQAVLEVIPDSGFDPLLAYLNCTSVGGDSPLFYALSFGDGSTMITSMAPIYVSHVYHTGVYQPMCIVMDRDNEWDYETHPVNVELDTIPTINFTAVPTTGQEPLNVTFDCIASGNAPFTYLLQFGDGQVIASSTPIHTVHNYANDGLYTSSCTVTDNDGDSLAQYIPITVTPNLIPAVSVTVSPAFSTEPSVVSINCTATGGDLPLSYLLYFGDSTNMTGSSNIYTTHMYQNNGTYTALCIVTDRNGDSASAFAVITILDSIPNAEAGANRTVIEGQVVSFNGNSTTSRDPISSYSWNFGDGLTATGVSPSHIYAQNSTYIVTLTVTDNDGGVGIDTLTVTVLDTVPTANFTYTPANPIEGQTVNFTDLSTAYDNVTVWNWNFGDMTSNSSARNPSHQFVYNGTYTVALTVTDSDGSLSSTSRTIVIGNNPIEGVLSYNPVSGMETLNMIVNCTSIGGNSPVNYTVSFSDGTSQSSASPIQMIKSFNATGISQIYFILCSVTDTDGDIENSVGNITVIDSYPVVSLNATPSSGTEPSLVSFTCSVGPSAIDTPFNYTMAFGDGSSEARPQVSLYSQIFTHTYAQNGTYSAVCSVTDSEGDIGTSSSPVSVLDTYPIVNFTWVPNPPLEGYLVNFTDLSTAYDNIIRWSWSFGDATPNSTLQNPTHIYAYNGTYTVTLTVTDSDGTSRSGSQQIIVLNDPINAYIAASPQSGLEPLGVSFNCTSTGDIGVQYSLNFNDSTLVYTSPSPINDYAHTYVHFGTFIPVCTVTDDDGDSDSDIISVNVTQDVVPNATLTVTPLSGYEQLTVNIVCNSTGGNLPMSNYYLNLGDGQFTTSGSPIVIQHSYNATGDYIDYPINCTVADNDGDQGISTSSVRVVDSYPVVNLTAVPVSGPEPQVISFTCTVGAFAIDTPFNYTISFGDNQSETMTALNSYSQAFSHTYNYNGTYSAVCSVADREGDIGQGFASVTITNVPINAAIAADPASGLEPLAVSFNCTSSGDTGIQYVLDFGDISPAYISASQITNYAHTYLTYGTYMPICTVTDDDGDFDSDIMTINVTRDVVPNATLSVIPSSGYEQLTVNIVCNSTGGNLPMSNYYLNFGDGQFTTSGSPIVIQHSYNATGDYLDYSINCTVADNDGDQGISVGSVRVYDSYPVVNLTAVPASGSEPLPVAFTCSVSAFAIDTPFNYTITYGDGQSETRSSLNSWSQVFTHSYNNGTYTAACSVADSEGDIGQNSATVTVANVGVNAFIAANQTSGLEPLTVNINCTSTGGNLPVNYTLVFGDSTADAVGTSPVIASHTYANYGNYSAVCLVVDGDGDTSQATVTIQVIQDVLPVASLYVSPADGIEQLSASIICNGTSGNSPLSYLVSFGDNSVPQSSSLPINVIHNYNSTGNTTTPYSVNCTVRDSDGDQNSLVTVITVTDTLPFANFTWTKPVYEGSVVQFTDLSTAFDGIIARSWSFSDGASYTTPNPTHTFAANGTYTVTLTVTDGDGDHVPVTYSIDVLNVPLNAFINASPSNGTAPLDVMFNCTSTGDNAVGYVLYFGDSSNTTSTAPIFNFAHLYTIPGNYTATCLVTDDDGDSDTDSASIQVHILDLLPTANLTVTPINGPEALTVTANCNATGGDAPLSYVLYFGESINPPVTSSTNISATYTYIHNGTYNISCSVTDTDGDISTRYQTVTVGNVPIDGIFTYAPASGLETLDVVMNCTSSGGNAPVNYELYIDDGTVYSGSSPVFVTHSFNATGISTNHTFMCQVVDVDGDSEIIEGSVLVTDSVPAPILRANATGGLAPIMIALNCTLNSGAIDTPFNYNLNFGDGSPVVTQSSDIITSHLYTASGNFTASCNITDSEGDIGYASLPINIWQDTVPVALLTLNATNGSEQFNVKINCSSFGGEGPFNYHLDFGDNKSMDSSSPIIIVHSYNNSIDSWDDPSNYTINCSVMDNDGDSSFNASNISVWDLGPIVSAGPDQTVYEGQTVFFNAQVIWTQSPIIFWRWWFSDNTPFIDGPQSVSHVFVKNDTYSVDLFGFDSDWSDYEDWAIVYVLDTVPAVYFNWTPMSPIIGQTVQFNDYSYAYDNVTSWSWNFGDTFSSTAQNPAHSYSANGSYTVTLTVTDGDGSINSTSKVIYIGQPDILPEVQISANPLAVQQNSIVDVNCTAAGGNPPLSYSLSFGDGSPLITSYSDIFTSHNFTTFGNRTVNCTVTDTDGDIGTRAVMVQVADDFIPIADISVNPVIAVAPLTASMNCTATGGDVPLSYTLIFGDGTNTSSPSPIYTSHTYGSTGSYPAVCRVVDVDGDISVDNQLITVNAAPIGPGWVWGYTRNESSAVVPFTFVMVKVGSSIINFGFSDINGLYNISLSTGTYDLETQADDYNSNFTSGVVVINGAGTHQDLTLPSLYTMGRLSGIVHDIDNPLYHVIVKAEKDNGTIRQNLTDMFGLYNLSVPVGNYNISALKDGYYPVSLLFSIMPGDNYLNISMAPLPNTGSIAGYILNNATGGVPVQGAFVSVYKSGLSKNETIQIVRSNSTGRYIIHGLVTQNYNLDVEALGFNNQTFAYGVSVQPGNISDEVNAYLFS